MAQLAVFNFEVRYRPGRYNTAADTLSQRPQLESAEVVTEDAEFDGCVAICNELQAGTAVEPDLAMVRPVPVDLIEGKLAQNMPLETL